MKYYLVLFIMLTCSIRQVSSQKREISLNTGIGNGFKYNPHIFNTFKNEGLPNPAPFSLYRIGIGYYQTPEEAFFSYNASINYDTWRTDQSTLNYIRLPLGIDFHIGRKLFVVLGTGPVLSYLFSHNDEKNEIIANRFQLSWQNNLGLGYQFNDTYAINASYQLYTDISAMYNIERSSPGGASYEETLKAYSGELLITLRYKISSN